MREFGLPEHLVIVGDTSLGESYVLDTSRRDHDGECPVAVYAVWLSDLETVAPDFGSFFWDMVQEVLRDAAEQ